MFLKLTLKFGRSAVVAGKAIECVAVDFISLLGKFFELIVRFPEAERHYVAYLKQHCAWFELRKLYR